MKKLKKLVIGLTSGIVLGLTLVVTAGFSGCKGQITWTPELVYQVGYCAGMTAGAVIDSKKLPPEVTDNIIKIMDQVKSVVPREGQTFSEVWTPVINEYIAKLTDITDAERELIKMGAAVLVAAIDVEIAKYPGIMEVENYVRSAIDGVFNGFQFYIKPSNVNVNTVARCTTKAQLKAIPKIDYDLFRQLDEMTRK